MNFARLQRGVYAVEADGVCIGRVVRREPRLLGTQRAPRSVVSWMFFTPDGTPSERTWMLREDAGAALLRAVQGRAA